MWPDKIALLDCDQVLARTWEPLIEMVAPRLVGKPVTSFHIFPMLTDEETKVAREIMKDPMFWFRRESFEKAQEGVDKLRCNGFEPICITAPWDGCKEWGYWRRLWLKRKFDLGRDNVVVTHRKDPYFGDLFIDDRAKNLLLWAKRWPKSCPVIMDAGYNQDVTPDQAVRMYDWSDIDRVLEEYDGWASRLRT